MIIILEIDFNLLRARQTIHQKRKETQTQMSTQFRMSKENSTSRAQSRLSRSDQPQGMFTHRSRSQHSMNVDHLTCHTSSQFQHQTGHNPLKTQSTFFCNGNWIQCNRTQTLSSISYIFNGRIAVVKTSTWHQSNICYKCQCSDGNTHTYLSNYTQIVVFSMFSDWSCHVKKEFFQSCQLPLACKIFILRLWLLNLLTAAIFLS